MSKQYVIDEVATTLGVTKVQAGAAYEAVIAAIQKGILADQNSFAVHGLGSFKFKDAAARIGRNPKTGEAIPIDAKRKIKFTPSELFQAAIGLGTA